MNKHQEIAAKRKKEILYAKARIEKKIEDGHPRSDDLKKRLKEYETSLELIEFTLKTGRNVKYKEPQGEETIVSPPAGDLSLRGGE